MMKISSALSLVTQLGLDTPPLIYFIEAHATYDARVIDIFQRIAAGSIRGFTSIITLTEVLVHPLRQTNLVLQQAYRKILMRAPNFHTLPVNVAIAESAADLRARYNLRTPDALQIATALNAGCEAFLTNDAALKRITELRILVLDELEQ